MPPLDPWAAAALLGLLALLATIRLSLPPSGHAGARRALDLLAHPLWLAPLVVALAGCVGLMLNGTLSPWPPRAGHAFAGHGAWAATAVFLAVLTADLWLLWTPSMVARRHAPPERAHALRFLPLLNLALGAAFLAAVSLASR